MKPRLDNPATEPLRYDYELLHKAHKQIRRDMVRDTLESLAFILMVLIIAAFLGSAIYHAVHTIGNPLRTVAEQIRGVLP